MKVLILVFLVIWGVQLFSVFCGSLIIVEACKTKQETTLFNGTKISCAIKEE